MNLTPLGPGNRIQFPADWAHALGLRGLVSLERSGDGILVPPCPRTTWDEIFATKLVIGSTPQDGPLEMTGDGFLL